MPNISASQNISSNAEARPLDFLTHSVEIGEMIVDAPYQRKSVWNMDQKQNLIRSLIIGVPIPAIMINNRFAANHDVKDAHYAVIDGRQRLEAIIGFHNNDFTIPAEWVDKEFITEEALEAGLSEIFYKDLKRVAQRTIHLSTTIPVNMTSVKTVQEEAQIYLLLNSTGTTQTTEDLQNAQRVADS